MGQNRATNVTPSSPWSPCTLEGDKAIFIPNKDISSDHIPVVVELSFSTEHLLDDPSSSLPPSTTSPPPLPSSSPSASCGLVALYNYCFHCSFGLARTYW